MIVIFNTLKILHTKYVGIEDTSYTGCCIFDTKFCMPCSSGSLVTSIEHEAKYEFYKTASLFCIEWKYEKICIFFQNYFSWNFIHIIYWCVLLIYPSSLTFDKHLNFLPLNAFLHFEVLDYGS
jgi:hypothetical protein